MARAALVIPTLNEAESIERVVEEARPQVARVIVADGGSSDATPQLAQRAGAELVHAGRGYGRACLAGALAAHDADIVVFMDGDGADDPRAIPDLVEPLAAARQDFVLGSRVLGHAERGSMAWHQTLAGHLLGTSMGILYGTRYTDMCALRAIRRDVLLRLGMREMTYGWNLEMQLRVARARLRVLEIPVDNRRRLGGESKVAGSLRGSVRAGLRIVTTFARLALSPGGVSDLRS